VLGGCNFGVGYWNILKARWDFGRTYAVGGDRLDSLGGHEDALRWAAQSGATNRALHNRRRPSESTLAARADPYASILHSPDRRDPQFDHLGWLPRRHTPEDTAGKSRQGQVVRRWRVWPCTMYWHEKGLIHLTRPRSCCVRPNAARALAKIGPIERTSSHSSICLARIGGNHQATRPVRRSRSHPS